MHASPQNSFLQIWQVIVGSSQAISKQIPCFFVGVLASSLASTTIDFFGGHSKAISWLARNLVLTNPDITWKLKKNKIQKTVPMLINVPHV
jgi:hypothetical protein